jgi:hypothetical protein
MRVEVITHIEVDLQALPFSEWPEDAKRTAYSLPVHCINRIKSLRDAGKHIEAKTYLVEAVEGISSLGLDLEKLFGPE